MYKGNEALTKNKSGVKTVRVLTGCYKDLKVDKEFDAENTIKSLINLQELLKNEK